MIRCDKWSSMPDHLYVERRVFMVGFRSQLYPSSMYIWTKIRLQNNCNQIDALMNVYVHQRYWVSSAITWASL